MTRPLAALLLAAGLAAATPAAAATTTVAPGTRGASIGGLGPIGQSFVADDTGLSSFGFQFQVSNSAAANTPVTFELRSGAGLTGSVIATRTATLDIPAGRTAPATWYDFDLGGTALTVGQSYTAVLSAASTRLALLFGPTLATGTDAYAAGSLLSTRSVDLNGACVTNGNCDANFRFTTTALTAAVPEPGSWALAFAGLFVTGAMLRRRRSPVTTRVVFAG